MPAGVIGVVEPDATMAFVPQSCPGLRSRLASLVQQAIPAHDARIEEVGKMVAPGPVPSLSSSHPQATSTACHEAIRIRGG